MPYDFANSSQVITVSNTANVVNSHVIFGWDGTSDGPQMYTINAVSGVAMAAAQTALNTAVNSLNSSIAAAQTAAQSYADNAASDAASGLITTGTFTPTLLFGGGNTAMTFGARSGSYIKINKVVFWQINMTLTDKGSSTGAATILGPNFTGVADSGFGMATTIVAANSLGSSPIMFVPTGSNSINLVQTSGTATIDIDNTNFKDTTQIVAAGHHRTTT